MQSHCNTLCIAEFFVLECYMEIKKDEAKSTLDDLDSFIRETKRKLAHGPAGPLLMIWGAIWFVMFLAIHFSPRMVNWFAPLGCAIGMASMWLVRSKPQIETRGAARGNDARIRLAWIVLTLYAVLWMILLHPQRSPSPNVPKSIDAINHVLAFFATVGMFGYVVAGLWLGRFWIVLGGLVTVLTVAGVYAMPAYFLPWMAFVGGGTLVFSGMMIKRLWLV